MTPINFDYQNEMIKLIETDFESTASQTGISQLSLQVKKVFLETPRHLFAETEDLKLAYENRALPIGLGQTISQPFIVALMTELLDLKKSDKVLEIGTGSGYQAAILAQLASHVFSIEVIPDLAEKALKKFDTQGLQNIDILVSNGALGWVEHSPYDKIIATAVASEIPKPLLKQLKRNGRMVIPLKKPDGRQVLTLVKKNILGKITQKDILWVVFVPFVGIPGAL